MVGRRRLKSVKTIRALLPHSCLAFTILMLGLSRSGPGQERKPAGPPPPSGGNQTNNEASPAVARKIRETVEALREARDRSRLASGRRRESVAALERQIARLQTELNGAERAVAAGRDRIAALEAKVAEQEDAATAARAWIELAAGAAKPLAEGALGRLGRGAGPAQSRRGASFRQAIADLVAGDPARRAAGFQAVCTAIGEEWQPARSIHLTTAPVLLEDGRRLEHARVLDIGIATRLFVSEDEDTVGLWAGEPTAPWRLELTPETRAQAREVIDVVRERRPPALATTPVWYAPAPAARDERPRPGGTH
jgi:hypothetical protein